MPPETIFVTKPIPPTISTGPLALASGTYQVSYLTLPGRIDPTTAWFEMILTYGLEHILAEALALMSYHGWDLKYTNTPVHSNSVTFFFVRRS